MAGFRDAVWETVWRDPKPSLCNGFGMTGVRPKLIGELEAAFTITFSIIHGRRRQDERDISGTDETASLGDLSGDDDLWKPVR
jgi:hypothetical protein